MHTETLIRRLRAELDDGGLRGSFLVRDLATGREIGIDPDLEFPSASLAKIALAAVTLDRIRRGELDGATPIEVRPGRSTVPGPTGLTKFRHPARVAVDDLLYLSVAISDESASDALFALTPAAEVTRTLREWGVAGIAVRHTVGELSETPAERFARPMYISRTRWPSVRRPRDAGTSSRSSTSPGPVPAPPAPTSTCSTHCGVHPQ